MSTFDDSFNSIFLVEDTHTEKLPMRNYYQHQLELPLFEWLASSEETMLTVIVKNGDTTTKNLTVNLESIPAIRSMLDKVESKLVEELEGWSNE